MFPSHGYFRSYNCPDQDGQNCFRAFCHFNHIRSRSEKPRESNNVLNNIEECNLSKESTKDMRQQDNVKINHTKLLIAPEVNHDQVIEQDNVKSVCLLEKKTEEESAILSSLSEEVCAKIPCLNQEPLSEKCVNNSELLHHLISEAVKKVIAENSLLSSTSLDTNAIVQSLDTQSLVAKAVQEVSQKTCPTQKEEPSKGKKHRLYLPPPGTPSYMPTPISELQRKAFPCKNYTSQPNNEEYTPTSLSNSLQSETALNRAPEDSEITDFSSDEDEDEKRSDFDMLEEVWVEQSTNPSREKEILKRKKALRKRSVKTTCSLSSNSAINSIVKKVDRINKETESKSLSLETCNESVFSPPSPIFTSSSGAAFDIDTTIKQHTSSTKENPLAKSLAIFRPSTEESLNEIASNKEESKLNEPHPLNLSAENSQNVIDYNKEHPVSRPIHNMLPQIAELSRPNIKAWTPVAKILFVKEDTVLSVEEMLERFDGIKGTPVDCIKEKTVDCIKDKTVDCVKGKTVDCVKGKTVDCVKGKTVDCVKENTVDCVKGKTINCVKEKTVDCGKEKTVDCVKEKTVDYIKDIKKKSIDCVKEKTVEAIPIHNDPNSPRLLNLKNKKNSINKFENLTKEDDGKSLIVVGQLNGKTLIDVGQQEDDQTTFSITKYGNDELDPESKLSEVSCNESYSLSSNKRSRPQKRSSYSRSSSKSRERKKRKKSKRSHHAKRSKKKRRRRESSIESEEYSSEIDDDEESDDSSNIEDSSKDKYYRRKSRRRSRSHHHRKRSKNKHKKKKDYYNSRSRSSSKTRNRSRSCTRASIESRSSSRNKSRSRSKNKSRSSSRNRNSRKNSRSRRKSGSSSRVDDKFSADYPAKNTEIVSHNSSNNNNISILEPWQIKKEVMEVNLSKVKVEKFPPISSVGATNAEKLVQPHPLTPGCGKPQLDPSSNELNKATETTIITSDLSNKAILSTGSSSKQKLLTSNNSNNKIKCTNTTNSTGKEYNSGIHKDLKVKPTSPQLEKVSTIVEELKIADTLNVKKINPQKSLSCSIKKEESLKPNSKVCLSMFDIVAANLEQTIKPKVLKEISIFDRLKETPSHSLKPNSRRNSNQEKELTKQNAGKSLAKSKKINGETVKYKSTCKDVKIFEDLHHISKSKTSNSESSKHSLRSKHESKEKDREGDPSKVHIKDKHKLKCYKKHPSKEHRSSSSEKSRHNQNVDKDSPKKLSRESRKSTDKICLEEKIDNIAAPGKEKESVRKRKKEDSTKANYTEVCGDINNGSDSPIPDLSALDELPKEDWDQLLCGNKSQAAISSSVASDLEDEMDFEPSGVYDSADTDDGNDPQVMEECLRLFSEYTPEENTLIPAAKKDQQKQNDKEDKGNSVVPTRKSRVANSKATGNLIPKPKVLLKPHRKTPAEVMLERYKKLKEEEIALQKKLALHRKQLEQHVKGSSPLSYSSTSISSPAVSSTSDNSSTYPNSVVSSTTVGMPKKRIARAPSNVAAMLHSKERIRSRADSSSLPAVASTQPPQTIATTISKGSTRIAHIPNTDVITRPTVSTEAGTKVPQNIRQRYLNCFIDETLKFCDGSQHAFNVALAEERVCHQRATTRMVYLNLAVNVIKKLRGSQISEAAQELLEKDPEFAITKGASLSSSLSSKKSQQHPINPNHHTISHFSVMACGGQKGSWSIQKPKNKLQINLKDYMSGAKFYKALKKYVLTMSDLEENGYPRPDSSVKGKAIIKKINSRKKISPSETERFCDRCSVLYVVDQWGIPVSSNPCVYHWGRPYKRRGIGGMETRYSCCQGDSQADGCCMGSSHVSENFNPNALRGYVRTMPKDPKEDGDFGVYALDCEMCYTTAGNELTRLTVVDTNNKSVYETFVRPDNPIIDYNTRFSGITAEDMEGVRVSLRDVQAALLTRFSSKTILMGHSLESDFSALKLIHDTVVDTSLVFPHKLGPPFKRALRNLASEYLIKIIQNDVSGHDSAEDAITCMELMQWRVKEDLKEHT